MCQRTECKTCHKPTYRGCGQHIEQVLGDVAPADRCQGHTKARPEQAAGNWLTRLRRR